MVPEESLYDEADAAARVVAGGLFTGASLRHVSVYENA